MSTTESELRAESAEIAARRGDAVQQPADLLASGSVTRLRKAQGARIGRAPAFFSAVDAAVTVEAGPDPVAPLAVLFDAGADSATVYLDAVTAAKLRDALLDSVVDCQACERPGVVDVDIRRCAETGAWLHDDSCHATACRSGACWDGVRI